jgi:hypothetical protein
MPTSVSSKSEKQQLRREERLQTQEKQQGEDDKDQAPSSGAEERMAVCLARGLVHCLSFRFSGRDQYVMERAEARKLQEKGTRRADPFPSSHEQARIQEARFCGIRKSMETS